MLHCIKRLLPGSMLLGPRSIPERCRAALKFVLAAAQANKLKVLLTMYLART